jgi:hypothetical protein
MKLQTKTVAVAATLSAMLAAPAAAQTPCTATSGQAGFIGGATTSDVTLGGQDSSACVISDVNPATGPTGDTSGFDGSFGADWTLLSKGPGSATIGGIEYTLTFAQTSPTTGSWSLTTDQNASFDLVFALHAGGNSGAFLFDDASSFANVAQDGSWNIAWLNGGGNTPAFSNVTFFVRDGVAAAIPEPGSYALLLAGLVLGAGYIARRTR